MLAPVLLLEVRKLLEQQPPTRALEPLHDLANVLMCPVADEHVHVVCCDLAGDDVQLVLSRDLSQKIADARRHATPACGIWDTTPSEP